MNFSLYISILICVLCGANGALNTISGQVAYQQDVEYIYQFESNSTLSQNVDMKLSSKVSVYLL